MKKKTSSIKTKIIIFVSLLMIFTLMVVGFIVFSKWKASTDDIMLKMEEHINENIISSLETYLNIPFYLNEIAHYSIENEIVNIYDHREREIYFAGIIKSANKNIYSFSYGTENGEYYGARRNKNNEIEIMKSDADTGGRSTYYSTKKDLTAGEIVEELGPFDPRTRDWYIIAKEQERPIFSSTYKHFVMDDLAISATHPIYDSEGELKGVLGTHFILSDLNSFLKSIIESENATATAYILKKSTGELVANSLELPNFITLPDNQIKRITIEEIDDQLIKKAYQDYKESSESKSVVNTDDDKLHINIVEYKKDGLDWVYIIAVPESQFTAPIMASFKAALLLSIFVLLIAIILWVKSTDIFLRPIYQLISITEKFSKGDFSQRAKVKKNDEVGKLSRAFNIMAEELYMHINKLEEKVKQRTIELEKTSSLFKKNAERLRITLFSVGDGFISTDKYGNIEMINDVAGRLTGWHQLESIGKPFDEVFYIINEHTRAQCFSPIKIVSETGNSIELGNETILICREGLEIAIELSGAPIKDEEGKTVGVVIVFRDSTEKREKQKKIEYLSYHDHLTGLYNRRFYEAELRRLDTERNLPITLVMADVNGLKLINDAFGHNAGDEVLQKVADIFKSECRADEIVARIGGDEFVLLLPKANIKYANNIIDRIHAAIENERIDNVILSISMGCAVKQDISENMDDIFKEAEDDMYRRKLPERSSMRSKNIDLIMNTLFEKSNREMNHSIRVSKLCEAIATNMKIDKNNVNQIRLAGLMHDIGKIGIADNILNKEGKLDHDEWQAILKHPEIGFRILSSAKEFSQIADYVLEHHEKWDGTGYPKGIKAEQISLQARIITIADAYDAMTSDRSYRKGLSEEEAILEIKRCAGEQFDPVIAKVFIEKVLREVF